MDRRFQAGQIRSSTQVLQETFESLTKKYCVSITLAIRDIDDLASHRIFVTDSRADH